MNKKKINICESIKNINFFEQGHYKLLSDLNLSNNKDNKLLNFNNISKG